MSTIAWSPFGNRMLSEVERWAATFARPKTGDSGGPRPFRFWGQNRWAKIETDYRQRPSVEEVAAALNAFE